MTQTAIGLVLAFLIGAFCRWMDIPSPAPPKMIGAVLVICMSIGFVATGLIIAR